MRFANFDYTIVALRKLVNSFLYILQTFLLTGYICVLII
nr:MAG TPA: hypothetical protein [Bacteriophage sp.]